MFLAIFTCQIGVEQLQRSVLFSDDGLGHETFDWGIHLDEIVDK